MPRLSKIGAAALGAFGWTGLNTVSASYLVVAGGGGGGGTRAGGGGAGGYRTGTTSLDLTQSYTVTVGAGGAGGDGAAATNGQQGSGSVFSTITSAGGGGGLGANGTGGTTTGGSGGGGCDNSSGSAGNTPSTSPSQGNNGGNGQETSGTVRAGGGGGGAGAVGSNGSGNTPGNGGNGSSSSISGTSVTYAGGGAGGSYNGSTATGGTGGGGNTIVAGTANLGGGGGAGTGNSASNYNGAAGGSGVVIISYPSPQKFGGGVVTVSGANTIHTFTTSGTLSPLSSLTASYLIVAGGGGGATGVGGTANGGGGGAGGLLSGSSLTIDTNSIYAVAVGAGGATNNNGSNSSFSMVSTAAVGGGSGGYSTGNGQSGGSGGGASSFSTSTAGAGTSGQGNAGGTQVTNVGTGGGGGAGAVGGNASGSNGGNGGAGSASSITGTSVTYAGGGGGSTNGGGVAGTGGSGGGGAGGVGAAGTAGTANLGGGGGGGAASAAGGAGGSGVVIISYPGSTQQMAGGTVTVAGGNVIHTFTSSGYLAPIYSANNSLRFRASASAYLNRTQGTSTNQYIGTWSFWFKRGALGTAQRLFEGYTASSDTGNGAIEIGADNLLYVGGWATNWRITTQVFRDPSAWYHIVVAVDTTQATANNRIKVYVNGTEITAFNTTNNPTQNSTFGLNNNSSVLQIGRRRNVSSNDQFFDGYLTEINFIDGQALTPNSFGTSNGLGVWQPIRYGGSYGTNGFYLPFTGGSSFYGSFNGSSQYLQATLPATLSGAFTLEFFLYRSGTGNQFCFTLGDSNTSTGLEYYIGTTGTVNNVYSSSAQISTSSNVPVANAWNHVAITRDSSNVVRLFVNGVQAGGTWTTTAAFSSTLRIGVEFFSSSITGYVNGGLSNFRIINGTALYTNTFAPPTSALTAVSGTSILTLQSSTIIDNSGNSLSITNNGTVTTSQAYPFTMLGNQSKDYSPQGNNWTNNNIGVLAGSTLDSMTDVPTLTSATAANYATLNPLRPFGGSLSNGNLTGVTGNEGSANSGFITSTIWFPSSGKFYFEVIPTSVSEMGIGITTNSNNRAGIYYRAGDIYINGSVVTTQSSYTNNDVIGVAVNVDSLTIQFYKNNTAQGSAQSISAITTPFVASINQLSGSGSATANINFGQQPFTYTPPTGFVALNTFNLPTPTIGATAATTANKYFDVSLYTGTGATQTITNSGSMQPDFIWFKSRALTYSHVLFDSVRGVTRGLDSATGAVEVTSSAGNDLSAFTSTGFTVGPIQNWNSPNNSSSNPVAWQWRASNAAGVTNTAGSITSTVSANTSAGFSIVTWTGNAASSATIGHGLGVAPSMIIVKNRSATWGWFVYNKFLTNPNTGRLQLNLTNGEIAGGTPGPWNNTAPTSTVFSLGDSSFPEVNGSGNLIVAYCFAQIAGYSAFGSYTGNGSTDGTFVYTGFRPAFLMIKRTNAAVNWYMFDNKRNTYNAVNLQLSPNLSNAEASDFSLDFLSNGFKFRIADSYVNGSGDPYIYACFAENPFKYANAR